jgi:PAS domain S-box-containing protein
MRKNLDERAGRSSSELLLQLVDEAPTVLLVLGRDRRILHVNRAACELFGSTRLELIGREVGTLRWSDPLRASIGRVLTGLSDDLDRGRVEGTVLAHDGTERWTTWTVSLLHEENGVNSVLVGRDITEHRREEMLRRVEDLAMRLASGCRSVTEAAPRLLAALARILRADVVSLWNVDTIMERLCCDWVYGDRGDPPGPRCGESVGAGEGLAGLAWARRHSVTDLDTLAIDDRTGSPPTALAIPVHQSDDVLAVVACAWGRPRALNDGDLLAFDAAGRTLGILFERLQARESLWRIERALRALHGIGADPGLGSPGRVQALLAEGRRRFGVETGLLLRVDGEHAEIVASDSPISAHAAGLRLPASALASDEIVRRETCVWVNRSLQAEPEAGQARCWIGLPVRKRNEVFGALCFSSRHPRRHPFTETDREILGLISTWVGAELEKDDLQRELIEGERLAAIGMSAATFAHEVAQPLTNMVLACEVAQRHLLEDRPAKASAGVGVLHREVERLRGLLEEFRLFSRRNLPKLSPSSLAHEIETWLGEYSPTFRRRQVTVQARIEPVPDSLFDRDQIRQVFSNLVNNAVEAMPRGGILSVGVRALDRGVRLEIGDTGCGIPSDIDVFAPFVTGKRRGTGLGLPIVRQLVTLHGGHVGYRSQLDHGTTFFVDLPWQPPSGHAHPESPSPDS